jgi:hypothetical protein
MGESRPSTYQKALQINLDAARHGTFAEIGAGQEVARWFFHVGGASGTVAKTVSAYDMAVSDALYGPADRYVSRPRLLSMLEHEYRSVCELLGPKRGDSTAFFAFANTMATRRYGRHEDGRGWMGIRFQHEPGAAPSEVVLHVWVLDRDSAREQEAIGVIGVNLVHGAFYLNDDPHALTSALMDNLSRDRIEIDMLRFSGPCFAGVDNRLTVLDLVSQEFTGAAMFTAEGEVTQASEVLHGKPVLVERGSFRPVTRATLDILDQARALFGEATGGVSDELVALMEMTFDNLLDRDRRIDHGDFLARAEMLGAVGQSVLVSSYGPFHPLSAYLRRYTTEPIAFAMGVPSVMELFREDYYRDLGGGVLEGLGRLFNGDVRIYAYPTREAGSGTLRTLDHLEVPAGARLLYRHLLETGRLVNLTPTAGGRSDLFPKEVEAMIARGDPAWEALVPPEVATVIRKRGLFGRVGRSERAEPSDGGTG